MENSKNKFNFIVAATIAVSFLFLSAIQSVFAQPSQAIPMFTEQECREIERRLPDYYAKLISTTFPDYQCVFSNSSDSSVSAPIFIKTIDDADLYLIPIRVTTYASRIEAEEYFLIHTQEREAVGSNKDDRTELSVVGGRAAFETFTTPGRYEIEKLGFGVTGAILTGNCLVFMGGENEINETFDDYHGYTTQLSGPESEQPYDFIYINKHSGFDHGALELRQIIFELAPQVADAVYPACSKDGAIGETNTTPSAREEARTLPIGEITVEALIESTPTERDVDLSEAKHVFEAASEGDVDFTNERQIGFGEAEIHPIWIYKDNEGALMTRAVFYKKTGDVSIELPDGTIQIVPEAPRPGMEITRLPAGSIIRTAPGSEVRIVYGASGVVSLHENSQVRFEIMGEDVLSRPAGIFRVEQGTARFKTDPVIHKTGYIGGTKEVLIRNRGTDFGVSYNQEQALTVIEIYDGGIDVELADGETHTLNSRYGEQIKRLAIYADGTINEQIAIPKNEWVAQAQKPSRMWGWFLLLVILAGAGYLGYRNKEKITSLLSSKPKMGA